MASNANAARSGKGPVADQATFYRRPLPEGQIAFSSTEGRRLFREALAAGHMEGWFALSEQFHTQAEPAFCGLGTLVVVLNALEIDPGRIWKGPWRWYGEELLDCCQPLEKIQLKGITLDELACLARCNGATSSVSRADAASAEDLREAVQTSTAATRGPVLVAGYSRAALGQTGGGHFSPIAGYHPQRDLALILDVARFKYPPHWVPLGQLWEAMRGADPATGKSRGWITLNRGQQRAMPLYFRLSAVEGLGELVAALLDEAPALLAGVSSDTPEALVRGWVRAVEERLGDRVTRALRSADPAAASQPPEHEVAVRTVLEQLRTTTAFRLVTLARTHGGPARVPAEVLTALLLALPDEAVSRLPDRAAQLLASLRDPAAIGPAVVDEIAALRDQLTVLRQWSCGG